MAILLFFLLSLFFWNKRKYDVSVTFLFLVASKGINLLVFNSGPPLLEAHNYLFLFANYILLQDYARGRLERDMRRDRVLMMLVYSYLFFVVHMLFTILLGAESIKFAFAVLRVNQTSLILYFIIRKLSVTQLEHAMRNICILFIVNVVIYLAQYWGVNLFAQEMNYSQEQSVLRSGTPFAAPLFVLFWFFGMKNLPMTVVSLIPLIGGSARGCLVSLFGSYIWYDIKAIFKPKRIVLYTILGCVLAVVYTKYMANSFDRGNKSFYEEFTSAFTPSTLLDFYSYLSDKATEIFDFTNNSTFAFRISMLIERIIFLFENPQYLLFGVGAVEETSPYNTFHFILGTPNDMYKYGYCMIDSADIVWVPYTLRYGLAGVVFWFFYFRTLHRMFRRCSKAQFANVGSMYLTYMLLDGFGSDAVFRFAYMIPFYVLVAYFNKSNILNKVSDNDRCIGNHSDVQYTADDQRVY